MAGLVDTSEGTREMVDLSAEAINSLGVHLSQIGSIISKSILPPEKGDKGTATRVREKLELYKTYSSEVAKRKALIEAKIKEDFERLRAWRAEAGTEGQDLMKEVEALYEKVRSQTKEIAALNKSQAKDRAFIEELKGEILRLKGKWELMSEVAVKFQDQRYAEKYKAAAVCSWLQVMFDEQRFRFKAAQEKEKLKVEHHQRMRKARAEDRLKVIKSERSRRLLQLVIMAFQEEVVIGRDERQLKSMRKQFEDADLIMKAQLGQALGDEEKAKELVAEQVRRMEEANAAREEAERLQRLAERDARNAKQAQAAAEAEAQRMTELKEEAEVMANQMVAEANRAQQGERKALEKAERAEQAKIAAEQGLLECEEVVRKRGKKIAALQRVIAELGAESDSDAPPDERPPAFFVNEDGTREPRPRTRKERMEMAYREAESARFELRLGMAAMLDRDTARVEELKHLRTVMLDCSQEAEELRWANKVLIQQVEEAVEAQAAAEAVITQAQQKRQGIASRSSSKASAQGARRVRSRSKSPNEVAAMAYSDSIPHVPAKPTFVPMSPTAAGRLEDIEDSSPRLLMKSVSQPVVPTLQSSVFSSSAAPSASPLAPVRRLRKAPGNWKLSWH